MNVYDKIVKNANIEYLLFRLLLMHTTDHDNSTVLFDSSIAHQHRDPAVLPMHSVLLVHWKDHTPSPQANWFHLVLKTSLIAQVC